jgi:hypothetical protein
MHPAHALKRTLAHLLTGPRRLANPSQADPRRGRIVERASGGHLESLWLDTIAELVVREHFVHEAQRLAGTFGRQRASTFWDLAGTRSLVKKSHLLRERPHPPPRLSRVARSNQMPRPAAQVHSRRVGLRRRHSLNALIAMSYYAQPRLLPPRAEVRSHNTA